MSGGRFGLGSLLRLYCCFGGCGWVDRAWEEEEGKGGMDKGHEIGGSRSVWVMAHKNAGTWMVLMMH